jgi:hypothetical protein
MRKSNELRGPLSKAARPVLTAAASLVVVLGLHSTGCVATVGPEPAYVEVDEAPVAIERYPRRVYDGHDVYYYRNRWYTRRGSHWAYYRETPPQLRRERHYVQQAPPARRRGYEERREAPPAVEVR